LRAGRRHPHSAPQARIDRPVETRRAWHPLPLPRIRFSKKKPRGKEIQWRENS
jgi:hypothetical protein